MLKESVTIKNLMDIFNLEIVKGVKNKKRITNFEKNKMLYLTNMYNDLVDGTYNGGNYNIFLVFHPKIRVIMAQPLYDKTINHFVARNILEPKLTKYLSDKNTATRKGMGTSYAINLLKDYIELNKKYEKFYFLKLDIKKYFFNIDHAVLKSLIINDLDTDEYKLMCSIIDSTNKEYVNKVIEEYNKKYKDLPYYKQGKGLPIGNMTSQFLATFYLHKLHHYIINNLKIKHMIVYMDDYILIHPDKEYLKYCLSEIEEILKNEYKLELNVKKTHIKSSTEGVSFLGYTFKVINKKTIIKMNTSVKRNIAKQIKKDKYLYKNDKISLGSLFTSIMTYKNGYVFASHKEIENILERYWY
ncbi:MAG: RNA-directed DNA polymerase [Bacilli bacterium]